MRWRIRRPLAVFCAAFLSAMFLLVTLFPPEEDVLPWEDKETVTVEGRLTRKEFRQYSGELTQVYYIDVPGNPVRRLQCYMRPEDTPAALPAEVMRDFPTGAMLRLRGRIRHFSHATNPGEFDSAAYYRVQGIACRMTDAEVLAANNDRDTVREGLYRIRCVLGGSLDACLNAEDAGVMRAMLLGDRSALDPEIKSLYQRSGIMHIIAISGLHISLIGAAVCALLRRVYVPRSAAIPVSILVMIAYGMMCGETPSAVRAIVMFILRQIAVAVGRTYDIITALALAAFLIAAEEPLYLTYSGFQLSFLCVAAVSILLPSLIPDAVRDYVPGRGKPAAAGVLVKLYHAFAASLAVALMTLPVYMSAFYTFPVYSVFLNLLILPLMSVVLICGILCMFGGLVLVQTGMLFGFGDHLLLSLFKILCLTENAVPGATVVTGHAAPWQVAVYYGMLLAYAAFLYILRERSHQLRGACRPGPDAVTDEKPIGRGIPQIHAAIKRRKKQQFRIRAGAALAWLALSIGVLSWRSSPALRIILMDVGQGDGILIESGDLHLMIDGGSSSRSKLDQYVLTPCLEYEGISHIDGAIITHEDDDHINGLLAMLENESDPITIGRLFLPRIDQASRGENYRKLEAAAAEHGVPVSYAARGDTLVQGRLTLTCLGPPPGMVTCEPNETSTILYLTCGGFSALFTGDTEGAGESALLQALAEDSSVTHSLSFLKVAHHGSRYTTSEDLLDRLHPRLAGISCGRGNRYGHPHAELLDRLAAAQIRVLSTSTSGAVTLEVSPDGRQVRFSGFLTE